MWGVSGGSEWEGRGGKGFGKTGRQNEGRSFPPCRFEGDHSRTRVLLGSPAKRHLRKIPALILPGKPPVFSNPLPHCHVLRTAGHGGVIFRAAAGWVGVAGVGKNKGISFGFGRHENQAASFPRGRSAPDRSRIRILLGSGAKRPHQKARGLFSCEIPSKFQRNPLLPRPADSEPSNCISQ